MKKTAIDFTFISDPEIASESFTGSLSVNLADVLDGISSINESGNFILLINSAAKKFVQKRFPDFEICTIGGLFSRILFFIRKRQLNSRWLKHYRIYGLRLWVRSIKKVWLPWLVPGEIGTAICKYIGTLHDMKFADLYDRDTCQNMINRCTSIICISDFTKTDLQNKLNTSGTSVKVIPNSVGLSANDIPCESILELMNKPFILDINAYCPAKNTLIMLKAYKRIADKTDCCLVLCGGYIMHEHPEYYKECIDFIRENQLGDKVFVYLGIPESQRNWLFKNCSIFVTPSENEGFGRTPIEASMCLKPVISTRSTSLPEVTMELVHYYEDPHDDKELADLIIKVLNNPDTPDKLSKIREAYLKRYSPSRVAQSYVDMFRKEGWI